MEDIDLRYCVVDRAEHGSDMTLYVSGITLPKNSKYNKSKTALKVKHGRIIFSGVSDIKIMTAARTYSEIGGTPHTRRPRTLYKSEYEDMWLSLADAELFEIKKRDKYTVVIHSEMAQEIYEIEFRAADMAVTADEAEAVKITLKERASLLSEQIPVLVLALGHKETPAAARMLTGLAIGYALSPIDLIPDFIPVFGYIDDVLILPGLISLALRLIPPEVMDECREKAVNMRRRGETKWFYAIPIVIFWLIVLMIVIGIAIRV